MVWLEIEVNYGEIIGTVVDAPAVTQPDTWVLNSAGDAVWVVEYANIPPVQCFGDGV